LSVSPEFDRSPSDWQSIVLMNLKEFGKYIRSESPCSLLHRARKASLKRILAHDETLEVSRKRPPKKRVGTK